MFTASAFGINWLDVSQHFSMECTLHASQVAGNTVARPLLAYG